MIEVQGVYGILVGGQPLVKEFLIEDIALFDPEHAGEVFAGINGIADPLDIAEIILVAFFQENIEPDPFFRNNGNGIPEDLGIAVSVLIIKIDQFFFIFGIFIL